MHNQGFIKFKNEENAQAVLENLNGFYFYEKPLIIVNLYMIINCKNLTVVFKQKCEKLINFSKIQKINFSRAIKVYHIKR